MADDKWAVARFTAFVDLSPTEMLALQHLAGETRRLKRGEVIRREGDASPKLYLLHDGWTASSIMVANGERQIVKVHMRGDLLGMPSLALADACDTLYALTDAAVSTVEPSAIGQLFTSNARLAALLFLISQDERVMLMDRITSIGRTTAVSRLAALILQLHARVLRNRSAAGDSFYAPLTQDDLGDLTGMTSVHVNRSLREMRRQKVVSWTQGIVTIIDKAKLQQLAQLVPRELARNLSWLPVGQ